MMMSLSLKGMLLSLLAVIPLVATAPAGLDTRATNHTSNAASASSFWLENIAHQGRAAFNANPSGYQVFRNVKDFGAKGDGVTDDTAAINSAISSGNRCGIGCQSSTVAPAIVYFPAGTYIVSTPIVAMYYSQLVGDPTNLPTLKASANFAGMAVIDADPYLNGVNWYGSTNNFYRAVRNFNIDLTAQPPSTGTGIHWQVAQATSLININFKMLTTPGNVQQGIFMDDGSGGFLSDLTFVGGKYGAFFGNQQFMTRNLKFSQCQTAIYMNWNWAWTLKSVSIDSCQVGIDMSSLTNTGGQNVGSIVLLDSTISNTPVGVLTRHSASSTPATGGSLIMDNVALNNVPKAIANTSGGTILNGGTTTIAVWGQGHSYTGTSSAMSNVQATLSRPFAKPSVLLDSTGKVFEKSKPTYQTVPASSFISVRSHGAKGDGSTDDTAALQSIFNSFGGNLNNVIFFDHGTYMVSTTVTIPPNTRILGEVWPVIMATGTAFSDQNSPKAVFQVGAAGDKGTVEMSELLFSTHGPQPGAILLQWNTADPAGQQGANAMWDTHFRVGGAAGTNLQGIQCIKNPSSTNINTACEGSFMHLHIGKTATLYLENVWAWTSDHELDADPGFDQVTIYNGRGILDESTNGPVWMYGTAAEHNQLYQYQFSNAANVFVAMAQTETPYYQANPVATKPLAALSAWNDPTFSTCTTASCSKAWGIRVLSSSNIMFYSSGIYSFFENYGQDCIPGQTCQDSIVDIQNSKVVMYNHNTVAVTNLVTINNANIAPASQNTNTFSRTVMQYSS